MSAWNGAWPYSQTPDRAGEWIGHACGFCGQIRVDPNEVFSACCIILVRPVRLCDHLEWVARHAALRGKALRRSMRAVAEHQAENLATMGALDAP